MNVARLVSLVSVAFLFHCSSNTPDGAPSQPAATEQKPSTPAPVDEPEPKVNSVPAVCPDGIGISLKSGKIVSRVTINGKELSAILDTGASVSVFRSDLGVNKSADVAVLGREAHLANVWVDDSVLDSMRMPEVKAVIGYDFLQRYAFTVDYPRVRAWLDDAVDQAALDACTHVTAHEWVAWQGTDRLLVPGKVENMEGYLIVDSGASLGAINKSIFKQLDAVTPRPALAGFYTPAAVGTFWADLATVGSIDVGGARVEHMVIRTIDDELLDPSEVSGKPLLGLVPSDFLGQAMVTLDYPHRKVRFATAKDSSPRLPSRFFPTGISLEEVTTTPVHIASILPKSAASEADVAVGDEVVKVDGRKLADIDAYAWSWSLVGPSAGQSISVTLKRANVEHTVTLETRDLL